MDFSLDLSGLGPQLEATAAEAIAAQLRSYEARSAIAKIVAEALEAGPLLAAVRAAVAKVDVRELSEHLAVELSHATLGAAVTCLREGMATAILRLRNVSDYGTDGGKERARVIAELRAEDTARNKEGGA